MKAAYIDEPGPPEKIIYGNLPKPKPAEPGPGQGQGGGRQSGRHVHPCRHVSDGFAEAVCDRLRPGRRGRGGRIGGDEVPKRRPGLGEQPGIVGPPRNFCRVCGGRRVLALCHARRSLRPRRRGGGAGGDHRAPGFVPQRPVENRRERVRQRRQRRGRLVRHPDGPRRGARVLTTAGSDEKVQSAASLGPTWRSTTRPTTWRPRCGSSARSTCGSRPCASRISTGRSATWRSAGG